MKQHSGNAISVSVIGGADGPKAFLLPGRGKSARSKPGSGTAYIDIKEKERKSGSWMRPILLQKPCSTQKISMA